MLKKIRRTVFYTFVGIYLILAPLVILYAFGYIFNPANLKIIRTGIIYLSSAPAGASVYFGKSRYTETTPVALRELLPGKYTIRLSLNKYEPWVQNIKVAPGKATVFDRILLTPLKRKAITLTTKNYGSLIPLPGTDFIILSGGQKFRDYSVFDCVNEKYLPIFSEDSLLAETKVLHIYTIPQSPAFIIEGYLHGDKIYVWCKPDNGNIEIENITSLFPQKPLSIIWNSEHTAHIFCVYEEYVSLLDITIKAIYPRYLDGLAGFGTNNNSIYELRKDGDFFKISYDKSHAKKIDYSPELKNILFRKPAFYNIDFLREDTFLFSENNGSLIINHPPYYILEEKTLGYEYSADSQNILFWGRDKIGVAYRNKALEDKKGAATAIGIKWLYLIGKNISQCFWVYQGSYAVFKDGNSVYLIGPSQLEIPQLSFITEVMKNTRISYDEETGCIYFLDAKSAELKSIELIPKKHLISNPFPKLMGIGE